MRISRVLSRQKSEDDHLSSPTIARGIKRLNNAKLGKEPAELIQQSFTPCSRQGLPLIDVTINDCGLLPRSFHLYPPAGGCFVSVALSLRLLLVAVSNCHSLNAARTFLP